MAEAPEKQGVTGEMRVGDTAPRRNASVLAEALHEKFQREAAERYIESFQSPEGAMRAAASALGFNHLMKIFGPAARMGVGGIALAGVMGASDALQRQKEERESTERTTLRTLLDSIQRQIAELDQFIDWLKTRIRRNEQEVAKEQRRLAALDVIDRYYGRGDGAPVTPAELAQAVDTLGWDQDDVARAEDPEFVERQRQYSESRIAELQRELDQDLKPALAQAEAHRRALEPFAKANTTFGDGTDLTRTVDLSGDPIFIKIIARIKTEDPSFIPPDLTKMTQADIATLDDHIAAFRDTINAAEDLQLSTLAKAGRTIEQLKDAGVYDQEKYEAELAALVDGLPPNIWRNALMSEEVPDDMKQEIIGNMTAGQIKFSLRKVRDELSTDTIEKMENRLDALEELQAGQSVAYSHSL